MDENGVLLLKRLHAVPMLWFVATKDQMLQVYGMSSSHFLWKDLHLWKPYLIRLVAAIARIVLKKNEGTPTCTALPPWSFVFFGKGGPMGPLLVPWSYCNFYHPHVQDPPPGNYPSSPTFPTTRQVTGHTSPPNHAIHLRRPQIAGIQAVHLQR